MLTRKEMIDGVLATLRLEHPTATREHATYVVAGVISDMCTELRLGGEVRLQNFGTLHVHTRPAGEGRNPRTGEKIKVAAKRTVKFRVGAGLLSAVNGG